MMLDVVLPADRSLKDMLELAEAMLPRRKSLAADPGRRILGGADPAVITDPESMVHERGLAAGRARPPTPTARMDEVAEP